jgi:hypothetical protein
MYRITLGLIVPLVRSTTFGELTAGDFKHIVIIPDTHGDTRSFIKSLYLAFNRIEPQKGRTITEKDFDDIFGTAMRHRSASRQNISRVRNVAIVQLGDLVDRGPHAVGCLNIADKMGEIFGWTTVRLIGNHELWNIMGHTSMCHAEDIEYFRSVEGHNEAFRAPNGYMFRRLRETNLLMARLSATHHPDSARNPNTLFVHGGLDPRWLLARISENGDVVTDMKRINKGFKRLLLDPNGQRILDHAQSPTSTRLFTELPETEVCPIVNVLLHQFQVGRIIVGHTPQVNFRVNTLCGGKIILADAIMSKWMFSPVIPEFDGNPTVVVMTIDQFENLEGIEVIQGTGRPYSLFDPPPARRSKRLNPWLNSAVEYEEVDENTPPN